MSISKMTFVRNATAGLLLTALPVFGTAAAREIVIPQAQGQVTLSAVPKKVAVFDLASLDILNALGVEAVAGVAKSTGGPSNFPPHIAKYGDDRYTAVGSLFEPDEAALKALKPDLIIIGGRSRKAYEMLSQIAPTVDLSSSGSDPVATSIANTRTLGRIFGVENKAEESIAALEQAISALRAQAKSQGKTLLLFAGGQNVTVQSPGSRFGHVYNFIGIDSVVPPVTGSDEEARPKAGTPEAEAALKRQQEELTAALAAEPDWIFTIDRSAAVGTTPSTLPERLAVHQQVSQTKAWKSGRVVYLDPKTWYLMGAGIEALTQSARAVTEAFSSRSR